MQRLVSSFRACLKSRSDGSQQEHSNRGECSKASCTDCIDETDYIAEIEDFLLVVERLLIPAKHIGSRCAPYQLAQTAVLSTQLKQDAQTEIDHLIEESVRVFSGDALRSPSKRSTPRSTCIDESERPERPEAALSTVSRSMEDYPGFELFSVADRGSFIEYSRMCSSMSPFLIHVPREIVYRSTVLTNALCDTVDGSHCFLLLPMGVMRAWVLCLDFLSIRRIHKTNIEEIMKEGSVGSALLQFLQVWAIFSLIRLYAVASLPPGWLLCCHR